CTRSTIACVFGTILFWLVCFGVNFGRHSVVTLPDLSGASSMLRATSEVGYRVLPKPIDMDMLLDQLLLTDEHFGRYPLYKHVEDAQRWDPMLGLFTSLLFAAAMLAMASRQLAQTDY